MRAAVFAAVPDGQVIDGEPGGTGIVHHGALKDCESGRAVGGAAGDGGAIAIERQEIIKEDSDASAKLITARHRIGARGCEINRIGRVATKSRGPDRVGESGDIAVGDVKGGRVGTLKAKKERSRSNQPGKCRAPFGREY